MSSVGLIYVGLVLVINGLMLLGWLTPREVGPLNLFVGVLQVLTPTYLIFVAAGDPDAIFAASGIYLFGFTYLWVGINCYTDHSNAGFGWFALLVAICAFVYAADSFGRSSDFGFGVVWLLWAVLWFLFFLVLGLDVDSLGPPTGIYTVATGVITGAVAFISLMGGWTGDATTAVVIAVVGVGALVVAAPAARRAVPARPREVGD